ncbi:Solute carrier organic anion transporter family member 4C1 [Holothuria leucospilota]|uniref:Solute carrier organic anion transporter family member n=1 Tax=Holothuria leucospilota TaxID=206669 RepID=A0A9Q1BCH1_HOLLE|nr:Solute carrier organic anion transporter family member 4C1 [Holothuria leucospilota]
MQFSSKMTSHADKEVDPELNKDDIDNSMTTAEATRKLEAPNDGFCKALHKPVWVLLALCGATFIQGVVTDGFVNTSVTSIERRFQLSSTQSGIIVSVYFFTGIFVNLIVSYLGGRGYKARWLAGGMIFYSIGAFVYSLPHFLSGYYRYADSHDYSLLCNTQDDDATRQPSSNSTDEDILMQEDVSHYLYFFVIAQVAFGLGSAPLYTIGIAYLDENVSVHRSGLYLGIFYAVATLGPAVGYISGGTFLKLYTDLQKSSEVTITPEDPSWVGAWWLGMIFASPLALCVAAFLWIFPRELPGTDEVRKNKVSVAHKKGGDEILRTRPDFGAKPADFFIALKLLIRNPTMMFLNLMSVFKAMIIIGFAAYMPKLVQTQFGQTASFSATVVGGTIILGGCGGNFLGGWLVKRFRWDIRSNLTFCIAIQILSTALCTNFLLRCSNGNRVYMSTIDDGSIGGCSALCACSTNQHTPVCALDGSAEFFSPCHAGCTQDFQNNTYGGCSCVPDTFTINSGKCKVESCPQLRIFLFGLFLSTFSVFLPMIPGLHAALRCVPESQRSFALGLANVIAKIFGSFPAPIVFGAIFDSTCEVWQVGPNGDGSGSCWLYNNSKLAVRMTILSGFLLLGGMVATMMSLYLYKPVRLDNREHGSREEKQTLPPL